MTTLKSDKNIIFGTGPLGLAVMDELVQRGREVTLVNRSGKAPETLPAGVTIVAGDATNADSVAALSADADVVFQCAQPPYHRWPEEFPPIISGLIAGIGRTQARLVVGDNLYMYGPTGGKPIQEGLPYAATGRKGRARAELAQQLRDAHAAGQIQVTIGRASDFYGPRVLDSAVGEMVFGAALAGKTVNLLGNLDVPHTYTYIRDFAWGLVELSEQEAAFGRAWHVPSAETLTTRQFLDMVGAEVGKPLKTRAAGRIMVSFLGLFSPTLREFKEMMYEFEEPYIVDHSQFAATFGASPTPHVEAVQDTIAWYKQHLPA